MAKENKTKPHTAKATGGGLPILQRLQGLYAPLVFGFSFLIYFNTLFNGYNLDDELVTQNHRLTSKGISAIPEIFSSPYYQDQAGYKYEYRPIVLTTFAIEHSLLGQNAPVSHFINVLLYSLLCVLLLKVLGNLLRNYSAALPLVITLLFAAHPVHTEVVASIKNRDEILVMLFGLGGLYTALLYVQQRGWYFLLLTPLLLLAGILSKNTAIIFALLIPVVLVVLQRPAYGKLMLLSVLLVVPALAFSNLILFTRQVALFVGLMGGITVLYALTRPQQLKSTLAYLATTLKGKKGKEEEVSVDVLPDEGLDYAAFFRQPLAVAAYLLPALVLSLPVAAGIYMGKVAWVMLPLVLLVAMYAMATKAAKLILLTTLTVLLCFALYWFKFSVSFIEAATVLFLAWQFVKGDKYLRMAAAFNFLLYALVAALFVKSYFFVWVLFFAAFFHPKLRVVSALLIAIALGFYGKRVYEVATGAQAASIALLSVPVLLLGVFLLWQNKLTRLHWVPLALVPVAVMAYFFTAAPQQNNKVISAAQTAYYAANRIDATDLNPDESVRPLKFLEYPLKKEDPYRIKLGTFVTVMGKYLKLVVIPYPLSFYYGYAYITPTNLFTAVPLLVLTIYIGLLLLAVFLLNRQPLVAAGLLVYVLCIVAFSGLLTPVPGMMGDRFLLIPSLGFCFVLAWLLYKATKLSIENLALNLQGFNRNMLGVLGFILLAYVALTVYRNGQWKDRITLFRTDVKNVVGNSAQARNLLGLHLFLESATETDKQKQTDMRTEAVENFAKALEVAPDFLNAAFDMGRTCQELGRLDDAYKAYETTIAIDSTFVLPCFNMALIQDAKGNFDKAARLYEKYLTKYPYQGQAYANLSFVYFKLKQFDKAIATNQRFLVLAPNTYEPTVNIAKTYLEMGKKDSAYVYFKKSAQLNPNERNIPPLLQKLEAELGILPVK